MARDSLSGALGRVARSQVGKWIGGLVFAGLVATGGWARERLSEAASKADVQAAIEKHEHEDLALRLTAAEATIRLLEQQQIKQDEQTVFATGWVVRLVAVESERRRKHKMESGRAAQAEYMRLVDRGKDPDRAALSVLGR